MFKLKSLVPSALTLILCIILIWSVSKAYYYITDDFTIMNISSQLGYNPQWEVANKQSEISVILQQPFYYLGKGCQTFALVSQDGNYILKFFKFKHLKQQYWLPEWPTLSLIPGYSQLKQKQDESNIRRKAKLNLLFNGYTIAYEKVPEETGLLYLHLNKTKNQKEVHNFTLPKLTLYDKMGFQYIIDLDDFEWVIQKRAYSIYKEVERLAKQMNSQSESEELNKLFKQIILILAARNNQGIDDQDPALMQNLGIAENQVIILDPGQFVMNEKMKLTEHSIVDIKNRAKEFQFWLQEHYPNLLFQFNHILKEFEETNISTT